MGFFALWRRRKLDGLILINYSSNGNLLLLLPLPSPRLLLISFFWMAILLRLLKGKDFNISCSSQNLVMSVQAEPIFSMYVPVCYVTAWNFEFVTCLCRHISRRCTTKSSCCRSRLCMIHSPLSLCIASVSSSNQSSILPCPNPYHPVSFTTDMWTGPDHESYICLTAHWFAPDWQLHHALLDILLCTDRHTGENLVEWIKQVLRANDICVWSCWFCLASLSFKWSLWDGDSQHGITGHRSDVVCAMIDISVALLRSNVVVLHILETFSLPFS